MLKPGPEFSCFFVTILKETCNLYFIIHQASENKQEIFEASATEVHFRGTSDKSESWERAVPVEVPSPCHPYQL
jgi:hypothetical protein